MLFHAIAVENRAIMLFLLLYITLCIRRDQIINIFANERKFLSDYTSAPAQKTTVIGRWSN